MLIGKHENSVPTDQFPSYLVLVFFVHRSKVVRHPIHTHISSCAHAKNPHTHQRTLPATHRVPGHANGAETRALTSALKWLYKQSIPKSGWVSWGCFGWLREEEGGRERERERGSRPGIQAKMNIWAVAGRLCRKWWWKFYFFGSILLRDSYCFRLLWKFAALEKETPCNEDPLDGFVCILAHETFILLCLIDTNAG